MATSPTSCEGSNCSAPMYGAGRRLWLMCSAPMKNPMLEKFAKVAAVELGPPPYPSPPRRPNNVALGANARLPGADKIPRCIVQ